MKKQLKPKATFSLKPQTIKILNELSESQCEAKGRLVDQAVQLLAIHCGHQSPK